MKFGEKLQTLRKKSHMSQEDLANHLHVSRQAVSKWERGEGYPEIETLVLMSELFQVSLDFLFKDDVSENENREDEYFVSSCQLDELLKFKKMFSYIIAIGVFAIIEGAALQPIIAQLSESLADFVFLMIVAFAVLGFVIAGMLSQKYKKFDEKKLMLHHEDLKFLKDEYEKFQIRFIIMIASGVFLILAGAASYSFFDKYEVIMNYVFLTLVACAVFLFVLAELKKDTFAKLINYEKYIEENKNDEPIGQLYAITMPLAAMIYIMIGFVFNAWHPGWLIFPFTAIMTYSFIIIKKIKDNNKSQRNSRHE